MTRPKRILMLTFEYGPLKNGGLASAMTSLVRALDKGVVEPVLVLPKSGVTPPWPLLEKRVGERVTAERYASDGAEVWLLDNPILNGDAIYPEPAVHVGIKKFDEFGERVAELLPALNVDLVHLQDVFGYKCLYEARVGGKPTVMTVHRLHYDEPPAAFAEMAALHLVDVVTTVSDSYRKENQGAFSAAKELHIIENGVDAEFFAHPPPETVTEGRAARRSRLLGSLDLPARPTFGYVGRMDGEQKGIDVLLEAYSLGFGDVNLLFVGEGEVDITQRVRELAQRAPERVRFINRHVPSEQVREILGALDFAIIPSRYEPFGLVQLEAMAMGAVPLASRTGGLKDVIVEMEAPGGFGRLVPPGDAAALRAAVLELAELSKRAPEKVDRLRELGLAHARQRTTTRMAQQYQALYEAMLARPRKAVTS